MIIPGFTRKRDTLVLPLRIDIDTFIVTHTGIVLDANNEFLVEYDTIEEAEVFVAKANGVDVATLRLEMQQYARMWHEYHRRLKERIRSKHSAESQPITGGVVSEQRDLLLDLGVRAERRGELQSALDLYANAAAARPDSALAWYNYGDVLLALKRYEEALPPLSKAVQLSPDTALFHYDLGLALFHLNRHEEASAELAAIVADDPQLKRGSSSLVLSSLTTLALSQDSLGRPDEAARTLEPALQTAVDILFNLGRLNFRAKRPARAIGFYRAAALLAPDSEDIIHGVGRVLMDLKGEAEAVPFLVRATKLNPRCTDAWYDLGVTLSRLKQRKKARSCFAKALRLDPKYALAHYDLACLDALEGKPSAAFQNLEKATSLGFQDIRHFRRDADLRSLRRDARWKPIVAAMLRSAERRRC